MHLAIFDLDNTLLSGDSDYLWGEFLVQRGIVDGEFFARENRRHYEAYVAGTLDIREFLAFALRPLRENDPDDLRRWRSEFLAEKILPIVTRASRDLLALHRTRGDEILIITATNRFVTEPIADALGVEHLLATEPECVDGRYTGGVSGTPCFREGKVERLEGWLSSRDHGYTERWFYSDSHNDLPLLQQVDHPVAVDPDPALAQVANARGWPIVSLRTQSGQEVFAKTAPG